MTFSDIATKARFLSSTDSTSFPDANLNVEVNSALDRVSSLILQSDGRWQWDDENNSDLPIATTATVNGQQDYTIAVSYLQLTRAEIKDDTGNWHKLSPIDQTDVYNQSLSDYRSGGGLPIYYDKIGNSLFLYPAPDYSQAASLKVWFKRGPLHYDYTANTSAGLFVDGSGSGKTTDVPGFNSLYHELIPLWVAYNFALANGKSNANNLLASIQTREAALQDDYSVRAKDDHLRMQAQPMNWQ